MPNLAQKKMLSAFFQSASPLFFLMSFFRAPRENFYEGESVEIDIVRTGEQVSVAMSDMRQGYKTNTVELSTNKKYTPPAHKEAVDINSFQLLKREPGQNPFEQVGYRAKLMNKILRSTRPTADKILRSMEWQCSQVLQTGVVNLTDENGVVTYNIDYKPKASHFPTAGTAWSNAGADILGDLEALDTQIRIDSKRRADVCILGTGAYEAIFGNTVIKERLNFRRATTVEITAQRSNSEMGKFHGFIEVANSRLELWTYDGWYEDPQTSTLTPFVDPGSAILLASGARLDATFGGVPNIGQLLGLNSNRVPMNIPRLSSGNNMSDLHVNAWTDNSGENLTVGIASRPLMIPTDIDSFGCITTGV